MRAVAYQKSLPIEDENALVDTDLPTPNPQRRDLLVQIQAVSVNPVDTKVRKRTGAGPEQWKVLGYDAAGLVRATGPNVTLFKTGDAVFYAGAIGRQGTNSEFHLVDERIVGRKPNSLDWAEAAAIPKTAIKPLGKCCLTGLMCARLFQDPLRRFSSWVQREALDQWPSNLSGNLHN